MSVLALTNCQKCQVFMFFIPEKQLYEELHSQIWKFWTRKQMNIFIKIFSPSNKRSQRNGIFTALSKKFVFLQKVMDNLKIHTCFFTKCCSCDCIYVLNKMFWKKIKNNLKMCLKVLNFGQNCSFTVANISKIDGLFSKKRLVLLKIIIREICLGQFESSFTHDKNKNGSKIESFGTPHIIF